MRIAMIVGGFPKVSETFILTQITGLTDLGHEIDIYTRHRLRETAVHPEVDQYDLLARTHAFDAPTTRPARAGRAAWTLLRHAPAHPRAVFRSADPRRHGSLYRVLSNLIHLPPFLRHSYDVIFCQFGGNGIDFAFLKDLYPQSRFVTMFHGDDLFLGDEQGLQVFDRLREVGDLFLVNTDYYGGAKLREIGFDPKKIATFHYGLPVKTISFHERTRRPDRVRILTVARLVAKKGLEFGIRAIARLQAGNPTLRIEYRIIGGGELRGELDRLIRELRCLDTIHLLGALPGGDVMRWLHDSDLFLLPSLMEQAGMVLAEAQASGLPVVATRVGGIPEMVNEGRSARLVPPGDAAAIAESLQYLLDHPEGWAAMGREGRRLVEDHHDLDVQKRRLAELLAP